MLRRWLLLLAPLAAGGCLWDDPGPYSPRKIPPIEKLPKASTTASTRIDSLGKEILAANPDLGFRPQFFCIGVPALALYHQGTTSIVISEGLVNRCKSDSELAAVLSTELALMASEARAQAGGREVGGNDPPYAPRFIMTCSAAAAIRT